ncbi:XRE family transcriptional regulator [Microvirgula aerodenitrificans]|uniref:XRE family transcriptional regulator n=1 Tax=Microvirgula aerodenitrificans TaxID=57480 RepID=A0A2S0P8C5_9NEIS|nr:XRE family transcriptional regulator [Microvirgula aerodenitrificans]AVY93650.1 XRE family transcriptional regulator [Microvirgula aerodenitrificans]
MNTDSVLANVSRNVRHARRLRGWSQERLAGAASVSRRMLVGIETGDSNVSLATLDRLAAALGLSFAELVRPADGEGRPPRAAPLQVWQGALPDSKGILMESLTHNGQTVELWVWRVAPGDRYDAEADAPGSHEMVWVTDGELVLQQGERVWRLAAGQSLTFHSDIDYSYRNEGTETVRFSKNVIVAAPPVPYSGS